MTRRLSLIPGGHRIIWSIARSEVGHVAAIECRADKNAECGICDDACAHEERPDGRHGSCLVAFDLVENGADLYYDGTDGAEVRTGMIDTWRDESGEWRWCYFGDTRHSYERMPGGGVQLPYYVAELSVPGETVPE